LAFITGSDFPFTTLPDNSWLSADRVNKNKQTKNRILDIAGCICIKFLMESLAAIFFLLQVATNYIYEKRFYEKRKAASRSFPFTFIS